MSSLEGRITCDLVVPPDWIDYNGHMNLAHYVTIFDLATDDVFDLVGFDEGMREAAQASFFVAEAHLTYQQEIFEGDRVQVRSAILDRDVKRVHLFHRMAKAGENATAATAELMILGIDLVSRRVGPLPDPVLESINALALAPDAPRPKEAGRGISLTGGKVS